MIVRNLTLRRALGSLPTLLGLALALTLAGRPCSAQTEPEAALRAKGLVRRGIAFCVPAELELSKSMAGPRSEAFRKKKASADTAAAVAPPAETAAGPADAAKPKTRTAQLTELLTLPADEAEGQRGLTGQGAGGKPLVFHPAKRGPVKTLQERFGEPDEIRKLPAPRPLADAAAEPVTWEAWAWGPVLVLVDETGTTRYFAVREE